MTVFSTHNLGLTSVGQEVKAVQVTTGGYYVGLDLNGDPFRELTVEEARALARLLAFAADEAERA